MERVSSLQATPLSVSAPAASSGAVKIRHLVELTKPRLNTFSVATAAAAYAVAESSMGLTTGIVMTIGTALSGAGALALNQWMERDADALMKRTQDRPLPRGDLTPGVALAWSIALSACGVGLLAIFVNHLAAAISALTIGLYIAAYTPLKRKTRWATEIGAIPGALPPLIGTAAATGTITPSGWYIFALLLFWQMPHFYAIGWIYRDEYRKVGFKVLPAIDTSGTRTAVWTLLYTAGLAAVAAFPGLVGFTAALYTVVSTACGAAALGFAIKFAVAEGDRKRAAWHLFASLLVFLPVVLVFFVLDRLS